MTALTLQTLLLLGVAYLAGCMCACALRRAIYAARSKETVGVVPDAVLADVGVAASSRVPVVARRELAESPIAAPVVPPERQPPAALTLPRAATAAPAAAPVRDGFRRADTLEPAPETAKPAAPRTPAPAATIPEPLRGPASIPVPSTPAARGAPPSPATPPVSPSGPRERAANGDEPSRFRRALDGPGQAHARPSSLSPTVPSGAGPVAPVVVPPPVVLEAPAEKPRPPESRLVLPVPDIVPQPRPPQTVSTPPTHLTKAPVETRGEVSKPPVAPTPPAAVRPPVAVVVTPPAGVARPAEVTPAAVVRPPVVVMPPSIVTPPAAVASSAPPATPGPVELVRPPMAPPPAAATSVVKPAEVAVRAPSVPVAPVLPIPPAVPSASAPAMRTPPQIDADDLTRIRGIDGQVEAALSLMGVTRYAQIAAWRPDDVARLSKSLQFRGRIEQENWIEQAQILSRGEETAFSRGLSQRERAGNVRGVDARTMNTPASAGDTPASGTEGRPASISAAVAGTVTGAVVSSGAATVDPRPMRPTNDTAAASAAAAAAAAATRSGQHAFSSAPSAQALGLSRPPMSTAIQATPTPASSPAVSDRAAFARTESRAPVLVSDSPSVSGDAPSTYRPQSPQSAPVPTPPAGALPRWDGEHDHAKPVDMAGMRSVRSDAFRSPHGQPTAPFVSAGGQGQHRPTQFEVVDDLKRIRGIGVLIEKKLNSMGITGYEQIANWSSTDIDRVSEVLDFKGRIERENWVEQARILAVGGHTEFSRRSDRGE